VSDETPTPRESTAAERAMSLARCSSEAVPVSHARWRDVQAEAREAGVR